MPLGAGPSGRPLSPLHPYDVLRPPAQRLSEGYHQHSSASFSWNKGARLLFHVSGTTALRTMHPPCGFYGAPFIFPFQIFVDSFLKYLIDILLIPKPSPRCDL